MVIDSDTIIKGITLDKSIVEQYNEDHDDLNPLLWVKKQKKSENEKKILYYQSHNSQLFTQKKDYKLNGNDSSDLFISHEQENIPECGDLILTTKDETIIDESGNLRNSKETIMESIQLREEALAKKNANLNETKKNTYELNATESYPSEYEPCIETFIDESGNDQTKTTWRRKNILTQYDNEININEVSKGFKIKSDGSQKIEKKLQDVSNIDTILQESRIKLQRLNETRSELSGESPNNTKNNRHDIIQKRQTKIKKVDKSQIERKEVQNKGQTVKRNPFSKIINNNLSENITTSSIEIKLNDFKDEYVDGEYKEYQELYSKISR